MNRTYAKCPRFNTEHCRPTANRRRPAGRRGPARCVAPDGNARPAPGESCWKSAVAGRQKTVRPAGGFGKTRKNFVQVPIAKSFREGTGKFHAAVVQPACRRRAVEPALVILYREASSPFVSAKWKEIHDLVVDGMSLADAMAKSPDVFPRVYVAMVEAGEAGGFLDVVLAQIADFQSREKELKSKVLSAMIYPCILFVPRAGGVDGVAGVFHSEIPEGLCERSWHTSVDHPAHHWHRAMSCVPMDCLSRWA